MAIYVAGPVPRFERRLPFWVTACYETIERNSRDLLVVARLPLLDDSLDRLSPSEFSSRLLKQIENANGVIAVFLPDDQSIPVECAIAAMRQKPLLLLHDAMTQVPRILAGLSELAPSKWDENSGRVIRGFMSKYGV
jgi:hypothetical protein